jgi:adenine-specific DNA-methyltransferase
MIKADLFTDIEDTKEKKLRGGYYTPQPIAQYITNWAIRRSTDRVLEPSCGDGVFIGSLINTYQSLGGDINDIYRRIHAVELFEKEASKVKRDISARINIHVGDFFEYCEEHLADKIQYDCIVGNPPFIRYQDFPQDQRISAFAIMKRVGLNPNKLTNTWIPFFVASTLLLKKNGRLGMVIPAELFQVNYASETRQFLSECYTKINIITFKKLVFSDIQQEVVVLLGEKRHSDKHFINFFELNDISDLSTFKIPVKNHKKCLNHSEEKWTQYYLSNYEIGLLRALKNNPSLPISGEYISVDVGLVTGQNKFFVVSQNEVDLLKINKFVKKIVSRANQLKGIIINRLDWKRLIQNQHPNFLLNAPDVEYEKLPHCLKEYIDYGISEKYHLGYKCRIRKNWWVVPSAWVPDAFMLRQVHGYPKLVLNRCNATATDTLHRVKFVNGVKRKHVVSAFINSLTFAFSEVTGRSYGGGVLTFEPSEAEKLPLPINNVDALDFERIDNLIRENGITKALEITDEVLLRDGLNLSRSEIKKLQGIWMKLRDRRINRR